MKQSLWFTLVTLALLTSMSAPSHILWAAAPTILSNERLADQAATEEGVRAPSSNGNCERRAAFLAQKALGLANDRKFKCEAHKECTEKVAKDCADHSNADTAPPSP